jgi:hypothetical protein
VIQANDGFAIGFFALFCGKFKRREFSGADRICTADYIAMVEI